MLRVLTVLMFAGAACIGATEELVAAGTAPDTALDRPVQPAMASEVTPRPQCRPTVRAADELGAAARSARELGTRGNAIVTAPALLARLRGIRPCELEPPQRLQRELLVHRVERYLHRQAIRKVRRGRPLARLPQGKRAYAAFVELHTTAAVPITELRAHVHAELAQVEADIARAIARLRDTGGGSLLDQRRRLSTREDRDFATLANAAQQRALAAASEAFIGTPRPAKLRIIRSRRSPLAMYAGGKIWLNAHPRNRPPAHLVEAIIFHEAIPGHHLQQELLPRAPRGDRGGSQPNRKQPKRKPAHRRAAEAVTFDGFVEGWGLYAEYLAGELDLYSNDLARIGQLELRAWRAARAAVDIGLHHEGWSLHQARAFMRAHTVLGAATIEVELGRVLERPGRVLAYIAGARELLRLRTRARAALGPSFSLAGFHAAILGSGRVPVTSLARLVDEWIDRVHASSST